MMDGKSGIAQLLRVGLLLCVVPEAFAATLSPEAAAELLARSEAANTKCHITSADDAVMLTALVNEAGASLARKQTRQVADQIIMRGRKLGASVKCDDTATAAVRAIFSAARQAAAAAVPSLRGESEDTYDQQEPAAAEQTATLQQSEPTPDPIAVVAAEQGESHKDATPERAKTARQTKPFKRNITPAPAQPKPSKQSGNQGLASYGAIAQRYYRERRCGNMSKSSINSLYSNVLASFRESVVRYGAQSVARTQHRAESQAAAQGC